MEFLLFAILIYLFLSRRDRKKRKIRTLDAELQELIQSSNNSKEISLEIKNYILALLDDDKNDRETYSDERLAQAEAILSRSGPSGFYFVSDIAGKLAQLLAAQANGIPTQIDNRSDSSITPEYIINAVIKS
jgi:hypothetical protein